MENNVNVKNLSMVRADLEDDDAKYLFMALENNNTLERL